MNAQTEIRPTDMRRGGNAPELIAGGRMPEEADCPSASLVKAVELAVASVPDTELRASGEPVSNTRLLLAVMVYSYAAGILSSGDVRDQVLTLPETLARYRDGFPFRHEIVAFRRRNRGVVEACLARTLQLRDSEAGRPAASIPVLPPYSAKARRLIQLAVGFDSEDEGLI
jgi:hypothetical protein